MWQLLNMKKPMMFMLLMYVGCITNSVQGVAVTLEREGYFCYQYADYGETRTAEDCASLIIHEGYI